MSTDEQLNALLAALDATPDNIPLRLVVAKAYLDRRSFEQAVGHFKAALASDPNNRDAKLGLARAFWGDQQDTQALVLLESMCEGSSPDPEALVMYSRLLVQRGDIPNAVARYKQALEADPDLEDAELRDKLGISQNEESYDVDEGRIREVEDDSGFEVEMQKPECKFDDVGGMQTVKEEIRMKIILPLQQPEMFKAYGKSTGGGILMFGPPGCGKTYLARATAGEIDSHFISIGLHDVLDMWIGNSERNMHQIFVEARRNSPCVLFFDEVDALGSKRSDMRTSASRHLINQFLSELDNVEASNEGLLILAATNAPWHIDSAFRRPGRFDRILFIPPPDQEARAAILQLLCKEKPQEGLDFVSVAKKTREYSGADLKAVVDIAIEAKIQEAVKTGKMLPLKTKDLLNAAKRHKPTTKEWAAAARNYVLYANQGGEYDEVREYLGL